jgi:hypothetical protein
LTSAGARERYCGRYSINRLPHCKCEPGLKGLAQLLWKKRWNEGS